jgi:predicted aspartyl protease
MSGGTAILRATGAVLAGCLLAACGERGRPREPRATTRLATAAPATLTRRASLRYEIRGRPFPLPVVSGTIAGHPVLMLLDTGANSHVIAGWFARKLAVPMKKLGDIGTDHVGKAISTYRIEKLDIAIDEWGKLSTTTVLATEVPDVIEKLGIAAFISPQHLEEEGDAVVVDLAKAELRSAWWDQAHAELADTGAILVEPEHASTCQENDGPVKGLAFVVPAVVDTHKVHLLVDTGAQHSDVFVSTAAGQKLVGQSLANKEPMYTASGKVSGRKLTSAHVSAGTFAITTDVDLIQGNADASCPRDGVLAMDVLRSCTLLLGRSKMLGRCVAAKTKAK